MHRMQAVLDCVPVEPATISRDELLAKLGSRGAGISVNTLKTRLVGLIADGAVADLSDGTKQTARKYTRPLAPESDV